MSGRPKRQIGRSDQERRKALHDLRSRWEAEQRRYRSSVEQLRRARALMEQRLSSREDLRRAEDLIRDEYHDSRAIIVNKPKKHR